MADNASSNWTSLIPEFSYDLIARIPAGAILVLGTLLSLASPAMYQAIGELIKDGKLAGIPFGLLFVILFALSYITGLLLTLPGYWIRDRYLLREWRQVDKEHGPDVLRVARERCLLRTDEPLTNLDTAKRKRLYTLLEDDLKRADQQPRVLLPKMNGEAALFDNVTAALLFLFFLNGILALLPVAFGHISDPWQDVGLRSMTALVLLAAAVWTYYCAGFRYRRLIFRLLSFARWLPRPDQKGTAKSPAEG